MFSGSNPRGRPARGDHPAHAEFPMCRRGMRDGKACAVIGFATLRHSTLHYIVHGRVIGALNAVNEVWLGGRDRPLNAGTSVICTIRNSPYSTATNEVNLLKGSLEWSWRERFEGSAMARSG